MNVKELIKKLQELPDKELEVRMKEQLDDEAETCAIEGVAKIELYTYAMFDDGRLGVVGGREVYVLQGERSKL